MEKVIDVIIGRKVIAFEFKGEPGYNSDMEAKIGQIGIIHEKLINAYTILFPDGRRWAYPYPKLLDHMVPEEEININEMFSSVIKLIKKIK